MQCPRCGAECKTVVSFCPRCGGDLRQLNRRPPQDNRKTVYIAIILLVSAIVIGAASVVVSYLAYGGGKKESDNPTPAPTMYALAATAAPSTPVPTAEPTPAPQRRGFEENIYRLSLYSPSATYKRMADIHKTTECTDEQLNTLAEVIFEYDRCCETYLNTGDTEIFKYIKPDTTAYNQQTDYKKNNPGLTQTFLRVDVNDAREYNGYYYVWVSEQLNVNDNGSIKNTTDRWVYKLVFTASGWVINDYTKDPVFN